MALDLTGIRNENEFYSDHYLQVILEKDLKQWVKARRPVNGETPRWVMLQRMARQFLEHREDFRRARAPERLQIQRRHVWPLLGALGYNPEISTAHLNSGTLTRLGQVERESRPYLWIVEALDGAHTGDDIMQLAAEGATLERLVGEAFFCDAPPRWLLIVSLHVFVLLDRTKWSGHRALRVDWAELFNRRTPISTFQLVAMLLSRDSLCPASGLTSELDRIDQRSKAHAQGVSGSLKYALREAVELLGNEFLHYRRTARRQATSVDEKALSFECLRYMYRMLFLFTVESRQELGYLPMNAILYREGYSLELLRDLEMVSLEEGDSSEGYFLHESLLRLFKLVFAGRQEEGRQRTMEGSEDTFSIAPLQCSLFDPKETPLLNSIRIRNRVWQRIIRMMSLGHEGYPGRKGRISYAQLGVNHLGEVYEALLSYQGFIAQEDLYEVKKRGTYPDMLSPTYFVNAAALEAHYDEEERVYDSGGRLVCHRKGSFIYRLTSRAREESASYYTPESLTQCVVQHALEEVLHGLSADEILDLTVCEPAMGSAAFLNEAVSQLAEAYLRRKTRERGESLSAERYAQELQRVKMYLADNNAYGVDLNPIAVELGGVSLWLNTLVPDGFVPWFGNQLKCGNSLVGAWRRVYSEDQLMQGRWWKQPPEDVEFAKDGTIYHFLVGDPGMMDYRGKVVKQIAAAELKQADRWKKHFTARISARECVLLEHFSGIIDRLWAQHVRDLTRLDDRTTDAFAIYPDKDRAYTRRTDTRMKERHLREVLSPGGHASAYQRLKLVMDYWCAL